MTNVCTRKQPWSTSSLADSYPSYFQEVCKKEEMAPDPLLESLLPELQNLDDMEWNGYSQVADEILHSPDGGILQLPDDGGILQLPDDGGILQLPDEKDPVFSTSATRINRDFEVEYEPYGEYNAYDCLTNSDFEEEQRNHGIQPPNSAFENVTNSGIEEEQRKHYMLPLDESSCWSSANLTSKPDLFLMVNPNLVLVQNKVKEEEKVPKDVKANNTATSLCSGDEGEKYMDEVIVHVDHSYSFMPRRVKVEPVPEVVEVPLARRPVGRPRKCTEQPKRYVSDDEEIDVESIQVKRPRRCPSKAKPATRAPPKRRGRKPNSAKSGSPSYSQAGPSCSYATDSNGFVVRQAKNTALKKIAKTKNNSAVSRSKRNDHNNMERKRRQEMKKLFDLLRAKIPNELLKDSNGKIKKNPSKNTILTGAHSHITNIDAECENRTSLIHDRILFVKRLNKSRRKYARRHRLYY